MAEAERPGRGFHAGIRAAEALEHMRRMAVAVPDEAGIVAGALETLAEVLEATAGRLTEEEAGILVGIGAVLARHDPDTAPARSGRRLDA